MGDRARLLILLCLATATGGCATSGGVPAPFPRPASEARSPRSPHAPAEAPPDRSAYAITGTALALRGTPYRNGGSTPSGFDCSGFVWYVFAQHGITLPRSVSDQFRAGRSVTTDALEPGDLVFFSTVAAGATHVGIAIGGVEFVHAPSGSGAVRVERLSAPYWASRFLGARRVT